MKVIFKKLKKVSKVKKVAYFFTLLLYLICFIYFVLGILQLKRIETVGRIIIIIFFSIWFLIYLFGGLISLLSKKTKLFVFITFISILCSPVFFISSHVIHKSLNIASLMNRDEIEYVSNLIALKETNFSSGSIIGMIEIEDDIAGNQLAKKLINEKKLNNKIISYNDYSTMLSDLYKGKIDACFVSGDFAITFRNESFDENQENQIPIEERVKVLYEYKEVRKNQDVETLANSKTKKLTEPFTLLVMGVDSTDDGLKANQAFNGDTLIMITFNPNTLSATMFSLPRDLYVPIACNRNRYNKINSSAAYGSTCVINTVQQLTGIDIDFYVKVNFKGVVDLVDALGGITINVEEPDYVKNHGYICTDKKGNALFCEQNSNREFGKNMIYLYPGEQVLNGEEALAYARNRHQYAQSDITRNQHQQDIILAMAQQLKTVNSYSEFEQILNTIAKNIETNLTTEQILSFYDVGKSIILTSGDEESTSLSIQKTYLNYYGLTVWNGYNASALGYYQESLNAITKLMKVNLGLEEKEDIKTFSISFNEDYTTPLVGQGLYGGTKLETLPNFYGSTKEYADNWCLNHGKTCNFKSANSSEAYGTIINQDVHENSLLNTVGEITFSYSNAATKPPEKNDDNDDEDEEENNNDKDKDKDKENNNGNLDEEIIVPKPPKDEDVEVETAN